MKRTITTIKELFPFEELSADAQDKAYQSWYENQEYYSDEILDTLKKAAEMFRFRVTGYGVDAYMGRIDYSLEVPDDISEMKGARLLSYVWNNCGGLWQGKYYSIGGRWIDNKHYDYKHRRSKILRTSQDCPLTGCCFDFAVTDVVENLWKKFDRDYTYSNLIRDIVKSIAKVGRDDYAWTFSEEKFKEDCKERDLYFTASGAEYFESCELDKIKTA